MPETIQKTKTFQSIRDELLNTSEYKQRPEPEMLAYVTGILDFYNEVKRPHEETIGTV